MRGSGVTAARSCLQPLASVSRYLSVHALPGDPLYFIVETKSKVKEVYAQTCLILGHQGMQECELFGLAILSDGEYLFVDPESKLSKYAPKNWRSSHTYGLDSSGRPAFVLYFRVRYYVGSPFILSDETTRHHYYLQLRDNVVRHGGGVDSLHPYHPLHSASVVPPLLTLAGLALQADLGDYSEERHRPHAGTVGYCKPSDYLPSHMCIEPKILGILTSQHKDNRGLSREEAELQYIREAIFLEAPLNAHLYRLRRSKSEVGPGRILLAICAHGVRIFSQEDTPQIFTWNNIGKLCFDRKKFEIRGVDQPGKLTLFSGCDDKSKLLLALCRDTHQFSMAITPRVIEAKRQEEEERKVLRDCYMYPARCKLTLTMRNSRADQRISLISTTSSNTTSGIVSDRVHSEDEPDTAPVSTECLPMLTENVSRLRASSSNCSLTELGCSSTTSPVKNFDEVDNINMSIVSSTILRPNPSLNASLAAEGSQCSSSCSTIVVANTPGALSVQRLRCSSASSSLELGYSHTAQNSMVSTEVASFPGVMYERCKKPGKYAGSETSGIYTFPSGSEMLDDRLVEIYGSNENHMANCSSAASDSVCALSLIQSTTDEAASVTSGFYTINSGAYTDEISASEADPIYSVCKGDEIPEDRRAPSDCRLLQQEAVPALLPLSQKNDLESIVRSRSNSVLSTDSFRGDGSDPSGAGPLLSADELSDLIVGRYPPRKTVSASLDSDSDYVTMPPPRPPPRNYSEVPALMPPPSYPSIYTSSAPPLPLPYQSIRTAKSIMTHRMPPPTPPRNDAVGPREPPPPPPPYPSSESKKPMPPPRIQPPTYPGHKLKPTLVHAPVAALMVAPNNYIDVRASHAGTVLLPHRTPPPLPPPPPLTPSPPLLPPSTNTLSGPDHGSLASSSQIEQYRQQLYSDVDYVMFPLKDPVLSRQEYIEAKQGSLMSQLAAYPPPPPYPSFMKSSPTRRSTPYLSTLPSSTSSTCSSSQNLLGMFLGSENSAGGGDGCSNMSSQYAASSSSLYSGATHSSSGSTQGLLSMPLVQTSFNGFSRAQSDENILKTNFLDSTTGRSLTHTKHRRLPPPPPPPPYVIQNLDRSSSFTQPPATKTTNTTPKSKKFSNPSKSAASMVNVENKENGMLDIRSLREKSRNLDLPLISALCNDHYLISQTKAFVTPNNQGDPMQSDGIATDNTHNITCMSMDNLVSAFAASTMITNNTMTSTTTTPKNSRSASLITSKCPLASLTSSQNTKLSRKLTHSLHKLPNELKNGGTLKLSTVNNHNGNSVEKLNQSRASHS